MRTWTDKEVEILVENYNKVSNRVLESMLPNKSPIAIYKKAYKAGLRKTTEIEFLNRSEARKGELCPNWKGGKKKSRSGYCLLLRPDHHRADSSGYVMEHIVVWEEATGVKVPTNCCIHHLNGNKSDNRIENLCLMQFAAHSVHHCTGRICSDETKKKISEKRMKINAE